MTDQGKKHILAIGDSGILGDRVVSHLISQGFSVKVWGNGWGESMESPKADEGRKSHSDVHMGLGSKQTAMHDETTYMPHSASRLYDKSRGNYVSADKEDTSDVDIRRDEAIQAASGGRGNAYMKAGYDPDSQNKDPGGEFRHKEWEKDKSSDVSQKKSSGTSGAGQSRYATETGSFVAEFMSMYSPPIEAGNPEAGKGIPGYQTIMESPYNNREATKDLVNPREHVDKGGAVDNDSSASVVSTVPGSYIPGGQEAKIHPTAYKKLDGSLDTKERLDIAFEGVDGLLFFGYSPKQDVSDSAKKLFDIAKEKGIAHVVYLSMEGASKKTGVRHLDAMNGVEQNLQDTGLSYTILRPSLYMEYFVSDKSISSLREGHLDLPLSPDRPVDLISAVDVGRVVAEAFQVPRKFNGKEIDLVADRVSMSKIASALGRFISKEVVYRKSDSSTDLQGSLKDHFQWLETSDHHGDIGQASEFLNRFNIQLTTFRDYLRDMKDQVSLDKAA